MAAEVVAIQGLCVTLGAQEIFADVSFGVDAGEIVSLVGPSGVGKTTLLKVLAGFQQPTAGSVRFARVPSREHPVILVFQDYVLFPNLSVFENVAFGLRARHMDRAGIREKVEEMLEHFHLFELAARYPNQLSAGQQQRVAIARAMVVEPELLLLDEPFANLDRNLKMETAEFIRDTQKAFGVATVSVTHDLEEAFAMSDKVGILLGGAVGTRPDNNRGGRLVQFDAPGEVYSSPATLEAARFLGPVNVFDPDLAATLGLDPAHIARIPKDCSAYARPEAMSVSASADGPGIIESVSFAGHYIKYVVRVGDRPVIVYGLHGGLAPGQRVGVHVERFLTTPEECVE